MVNAKRKVWRAARNEWFEVQGDFVEKYGNRAHARFIEHFAAEYGLLCRGLFLPFADQFTYEVLDEQKYLFFLLRCQ